MRYLLQKVKDVTRFVVLLRQSAGLLRLILRGRHTEQTTREGVCGFSALAINPASGKLRVMLQNSVKNVWAGDWTSTIAVKE